MLFAQAMLVIEKHFKRSVFKDNAGDALSDDEFIDLLNAVQEHLPLKSAKKNETVARFLWSGCRKFNRWFVPSPYIVPRDFADRHALFVEALLKLEGQNSENTAVFCVHLIRDGIYRAFNEIALPLDNNEKALVEHFANSLDAIRIPRNNVKQHEFLVEFAVARSLIEGLHSGNLKTFFHIAVPYALVKQQSLYRFMWQGLTVQAKLSPNFRPPESLMLMTPPPTVMTPRTATRWQFGATEIELTFNSLIDPSVRVQPLQLPMEKSPAEGWPNGFNVAFQLIFELTWILRQREEFIGIWSPSPADLGDLQCWMSTMDNAQLAFIRKSNPAIGFSIFVSGTAEQTNEVDLGQIAVTPPHRRWRILAEQYLALGDTREAMFCLNVGVEAFLKVQMASIIAETKSDMEVADISGAKSYWQNAQDVVSEKFPEIAAQIDWPKSVPHVSMFRQLKYFARHIKLLHRSAEYLSHYSSIQRFRNALFHGESDGSISAEVVKTGLHSFDWLLVNFKAEPPA